MAAAGSGAERVLVRSRNRDGDRHETAVLTQVLEFTMKVDGASCAFVQSYVYFPIEDDADGVQLGYVRLLLTSSAAQHESVLPDFAEFARTVRPDRGRPEIGAILTPER